MWRKTICVILLAIITSGITVCEQNSITSYYSIRSQSFNDARLLSGQAEYQLPSSVCQSNSLFSVGLAYIQSFDQNSITRSIFGDQNCPVITISGSTVENRGATDWLADYFYLPTDFKSTLSFKPRIDQIILDFNFYSDLNEWCQGLYFFIEAPLEYSRWRLRMSEKILSQGSDLGSYPAGYFTSATVDTSLLLNSFCQYAQGFAPDPITQLVNSNALNGSPPPALPQITVNLNPLTRAKITPRKRTTIHFADLRANVGIVVYQDDCAHLGFYLQAAAPTGNRPQGKYLFESIVGNGHHAEFGIGMQGHVDLGHCHDSDSTFSLYGDVVVTHLFGTRQRRTFDLIGKRFSRYMLAQKMAPATIAISGNPSSPASGPFTPVANVFDHSFNPLANLSTVKVHVHIPVQLQFALMLNAQCDNWNLDVGYNFWYRSCDKLTINSCNTPFNKTVLWALKGDSQVFGFASNIDPSVPSQFNQFDAIQISPTESQATINSGTNAQMGAINNFGVDNAQFAYAGANNIALLSGPLLSSLPIKTSVPPVLLSLNNLDLDSSKTRAMSSTLFTNLSYVWQDCYECQPFVGIGGQVEIGHKVSSTVCTSTSLSVWGIWIKTGVTFT